jgi:hypothetical protein
MGMFGNGYFVFSLMWVVAYWLIWWSVKRVMMYRSTREHESCCRDLCLGHKQQ